MAAMLLVVTVMVAGTIALASGVITSDDRETVTSDADPYFPNAGNAGYQVSHYDLQLTYTPPAEPGPLEPPPLPATLRGELAGVATLDVTATDDLEVLTLDLRGLTVRSVHVDGDELERVPVPDGGGEPAAEPGADPGAEPGADPGVEDPGWWHVQDDAERRWKLHLALPDALAAGDRAQVEVAYGGATTRPTDINGDLYGWVTTRDGAMVVNQPDGAMTWYPVNDHPTDKASYTFAITVPEGKVAVANGLPDRDPVTEDGWTSWYWDAPDQQASFVTTASVGDYELREPYRSSSGVPILDAVDRKLTPAARGTTDASLALQPAMIDFLEERFGDYPFVAYGAIVDDDDVGYALETQTRPVYSGEAAERTVVHELAHQWFGNAVSPQRWQDIWLSEGWATYAEWLWEEETGGPTAQETFDAWYATDRDDAGWSVVIADPGPEGLFAAPVYERGAATLHALRERIGDEAFFDGARRWLERHDDGTATTDDLEALYAEVADQDLSAFFDTWLREPSKPTDW